MLAAVAPPAAGASLGLLVDLGIFALFFACLLMRKAWVSTLGKLLLKTADLIGGIQFSVKVFRRGFTIGLGPVADILRGINADALNLLGAGIEATHYAGSHLWNSIAYLVEATGRTIGHLGEWTYGELRHVAHVVIPLQLGVRIDPLERLTTTLAHRLAQLATHPTTIVRPITRIIDPRIKVLEREVDTLSRAVAHIGAGALSPSLPLPTWRPGWVRTGIDELREQLGRVTRVLTPAGIVGLTAAAVLSSLDLGWLKCRGVNRMGHALCGLGGLLETLLGDAIEAILVTDLCQVVSAISYTTRQLEPLLLDFVAVENALIGCPGASWPPDLNVAPLSVPPTTGLVLS